MNILSNNLAKKETPEFEPQAKVLSLRFKQVKKSNLGANLALSWLKSVASPKEFSKLLQIGERQIYKWINHEAPLPAERVEQIIWAAITLMIPLLKLREETDRYLLMMRDPTIE